MNINRTTQVASLIKGIAMRFRGIAGVCALATISFSASGHRAMNSATDDQPVVVSAVAPFYPPIAAVAHAMGKVVVEVTINNEGSVTAAKAASGHPLLQAACEKTAKRWRFLQTNEATRSRNAVLTFVFSFRSDGPEPSAAERDLIIFTPPYQVELSRFEVIRQTQSGR